MEVIEVTSHGHVNWLPKLDGCWLAVDSHRRRASALLDSVLGWELNLCEGCMLLARGCE